jgi:acyl-homoserine lactone acylase PvdQ
MPGMETITDNELKRIGLYVHENEESLFKIDNSLFHTRTKKGSLNVTAELDEGNEYTFEVHARQENGGSNCWAVHGNITESGKSILACDPHLAKMMNGFWYATRLSWDYEVDGRQERTFVAGGSNIGIPLFTYLLTPFAASGVTSLNPDILDLYVDEVKDDTFLASDGTWKPMVVEEETIKVRLGFDIKFQVRFTDNGVVLP